MHVHVDPGEAPDQLAHGDDLRSLRFTRLQTSGLDHDRRAETFFITRSRRRMGEHDGGPSPRLVDRERRPEQPDLVAAVLAVDAKANERDLLPRRQDPQDEPRERVAGDFVHLRAGLALAHKRSRDHDLPPTPEFETNSSQARASLDLSQSAQYPVRGRAARFQDKLTILVM